MGEGNGNPLQCSCLENPRDGGAWWAAVYGRTESDTTEVTYIGKDPDAHTHPHTHTQAPQLHCCSHSLNTQSAYTPRRILSLDVHVVNSTPHYRQKRTHNILFMCTHRHPNLNICVQAHERIVGLRAHAAQEQCSGHSRRHSKKPLGSSGPQASQGGGRWHCLIRAVT